MRPTLARLVLAGIEPSDNNGTDLCPAVITHVFGERSDGSWMINVKALTDGPADKWKTSVVLFATEQEARDYGILGACFWPPRP